MKWFSNVWMARLAALRQWMLGGESWKSISFLRMVHLRAADASLSSFGSRGLNPRSSRYSVAGVTMPGIGPIFHWLSEDCIAVVVVQHENVFVPATGDGGKQPVKSAEIWPAMSVTVCALGMPDGGLVSGQVLGALVCVEQIFFRC